MKRKFVSPAALIALLAVTAVPAYASDCDLEDTVVLKLFSTTPADLFAPAAAPVVSTSYHIGQSFDVKVGDVLLRRMISPAGQTASFADDIQYGSRLPFTKTYKLAKGQPYALLDIPAAPQLHALVVPSDDSGTDEYLFLDSQGHLCEHALKFVHWNENITYRAGTYRAKPDTAATISTSTPDDRTQGDGTTIVLNGIDAAAIDLTTRKTVDGTMSAAQHASFDRSNPEIHIDGFVLKVDAVRDDGMTLSVVAEPKPADATQAQVSSLQ
ncbi:hypothetical protein [Solimonas marina]|uniref:Uncharacterized protein n=1 Tax=Solimonas marina TaxID=2714601 RepID=A0A970B622_9GAMM|nr:hypothetical protein [Solimonas marina]NKF22343.1 hypothetical protein [Solimonas marina]